ncbi:MAG: hypothetical protein ACLSVX_12370 [Massilimicrobiota timonensis]
MNIVSFGSDKHLTNEEIEKIQNSIFETLKGELDKDMCNYKVIHFIITDLDERLKEKTINL